MQAIPTSSLVESRATAASYAARTASGSLKRAARQATILALCVVAALFASATARGDQSVALFAAENMLVDETTNTIHLWNGAKPFTIGLFFDNDSVTKDEATDLSNSLSDLLKEIEASSGVQGQYQVGKLASSVYIIFSRLPLNAANKQMLDVISMTTPWQLDSSDPLTNLMPNCYVQVKTVDHSNTPASLGGVGGFLYISLKGGLEGAKECMSRKLPHFLGIRANIPEDVFIGFSGRGSTVGLHDLEKYLLDLLYKTPGVTPEMPKVNFLDAIRKRMSSGVQVQ